MWLRSDGFPSQIHRYDPLFQTADFQRLLGLQVVDTRSANVVPSPPLAAYSRHNSTRLVRPGENRICRPAPPLPRGLIP